MVEKEKRVLPDSLVKMEKTESKVHKVFKDSKVFKGRQEKEEKKDLPDGMVHKAGLAQRV